MNFRKYLSNVRDYDMDDALNMVGLQKHSSGDWVFPMLAGLGAGMAIGAGLAFFLTPYKGTEAREKVMKGASEAQKMISEKVSPYIEKLAEIGVVETPAAGTAGHTTPGARIPASTTGNRSY